MNKPAGPALLAAQLKVCAARLDKNIDAEAFVEYLVTLTNIAWKTGWDASQRARGETNE